MGGQFTVNDIRTAAGLAPLVDGEMSTEPAFQPKSNHHRLHLTHAQGGMPVPTQRSSIFWWIGEVLFGSLARQWRHRQEQRRVVNQQYAAQLAWERGQRTNDPHHWPTYDRVSDVPPVRTECFYDPPDAPSRHKPVTPSPGMFDPAALEPPRFGHSQFRIFG